MAHWTTRDIPAQAGRSAVVTGTGGIGFQDALALTRAGANVILAGRNRSKGLAAVDRIRQSAPDGQIAFEAVDLADLGSIEAFGKRLRSSLGGLDLLINNAAVMTPPVRMETVDGFELQFGTNHLGHFALTAHLLPLLRNGKQPRIVSLSSIAARDGKIELEDLQSERSYVPMVAYSQSKLACLMFALELQRRSDALGWGLQSLAAHPGISRTDLLPNGAGAWSAPGLIRRGLWFLFQPAAQGALPTLFAATSPHAQAGHYYGPHRFSETRGYPAAARLPAQARDDRIAAALWLESERLVGMAFPGSEYRHCPARPAARQSPSG